MNLILERTEFISPYPEWICVPEVVFSGIRRPEHETSHSDGCDAKRCSSIAVFTQLYQSQCTDAPSNSAGIIREPDKW
jgi:hypothetical protein